MTLKNWPKARTVYLRSKTVASSTMKVCVSYSKRSVRRRPTIPFIEDELQNVNMAEEERVEKNKELKIKRRDYTGYDDDEFVEGTQGMKRAVLAKYDEFLEGPRQTVSGLQSFLYIMLIDLPGIPFGKFCCIQEGNICQERH